MPRDDDFSAATKRLIAQRSGYMCAFPSCLAPTAGPGLDPKLSVNIGEATHITAASKGRPRYDESLTSEERQDAENGIWMCRTHAALIDRDIDRYPADLLRDWKYEAEGRAMRVLGQPSGCAQGLIATVSQAIRIGPDAGVMVDHQAIPHSPIFDVDKDGDRVTWFVSGFVVQFSIQKRQNLTHAVLDYLTVTVHETKPIPSYEILPGAYPSEVSLFYVEIDTTSGTARAQFRPSRFYTMATDDTPESKDYPRPIVLDDNLPSQVAIRINAKTSGFYLISMDATISSGGQSETLTVMAPQWVIFERFEPFIDADSETDESASCNHALQPPPGPLPPMPLPIDPILRQPVSLVVIDDVLRTQPDTRIVLNATGVWDSITAGGSDWLFCDRESTEATAKQAVADMGATPVPALLICSKTDRKLLASLPLPKTVSDLRATVATYTGGK